MNSNKLNFKNELDYATEFSLVTKLNFAAFRLLMEKLDTSPWKSSFSLLLAVKELIRHAVPIYDQLQLFGPWRWAYTQ